MVHNIKELEGIHPMLAKTVLDIANKTDFRVVDGLRTKAEQLKNIAKGTSKTLKSYHLYGLAVDLVPIVGGTLTWDVKGEKNRVNYHKTLELYKPIADLMIKYGKSNGINIEWGFALWGWDMPHFQITKINGIDARKCKFDTYKVK
jgi:peptidoglycan L-alanyl-D-glutamate endopeptidase CwlK